MAREQSRARSIWRTMIAAAAGTVVCVSTAVAAYRVRNFALRDPQFTLSRDRRDALVVLGVRNASRARVTRAFDTDFGLSVFAVPLGERRRRLMAIDWVEDAAISRIWPNRLVVRITERRPVAFVNLPLAVGATRVLLIDGQGVLLEPPPQSQFAFPVLRGITEGQPEVNRRARVRAMQALLDDLGPAAKDISEVNAEDLENLRVMTQFDGRAVELIMGDGNWGRRYQAFAAHYPEIRKRSGAATVFDLRLDDRITAKE